MKTIRLAMNGATGKMGKRILCLAAENPTYQIVAAIERPGHPSLEQDIGPLIGLPPLNVPLSDKLDIEADLMIDFSIPASTLQRVEECQSGKVAMIIGTTGLTPEQEKIPTEAGNQIPILMEPNMSAGVHILIQAAANLAKNLGDEYDIEIIEAHHRRKVDSPSGTALKILDRIASARKICAEDDVVHGRHGQVGPRECGQIGMHAVRGGDIVGDHTILFSGPGEQIELTHRASNRDTFASGALLIGKNLVQKSPGRYRIEEVISLDE